jgi:hypothetical protein
VAEVYPRLCTGPVVKSRAAARAEAWARAAIPAPASLADLAVAGEDAFDAAVTASVVSRGLPWSTVDLPPVATLEGWALGA